jgi:hypothetical protein
MLSDGCIYIVRNELPVISRFFGSGLNQRIRSPMSSIRVVCFKSNFPIESQGYVGWRLVNIEMTFAILLESA